MTETEECGASYTKKFKVQEDKDFEQVVHLARKPTALKKERDSQKDRITKLQKEVTASRCSSVKILHCHSYLTSTCELVKLLQSKEHSQEFFFYLSISYFCICQAVGSKCYRWLVWV